MKGLRSFCSCSAFDCHLALLCSQFNHMKGVFCMINHFTILDEGLLNTIRTRGSMTFIQTFLFCFFQDIIVLVSRYSICFRPVLLQVRMGQINLCKNQNLPFSNVAETLQKILAFS